jgi:hypothetical protein
MNFGEILDNDFWDIGDVRSNKPAKIAALTPDEYERMAFLKDPKEAYENCEECIGQGAFGAAAMTASGFVIKRFDIQDAYGMWLSFCMWAYHRGSGNAQLPKVFAMCIPKNVGAGPYGYALMEKLSKHDTIFDGRARADDTYHFRDGLHTINNAVTAGNPIAGISKTPFERLFAEFLVLANSDGMRIGVDTHMGNILFRNAGTEKEVLVITDPVLLCGGSHADALRFMRKMLSMVSMYKPAMWSELCSRTIIEATVQ